MAKNSSSTMRDLGNEISTLNKLIDTATKQLNKAKSGGLNKETAAYQKQLTELIKKTKKLIDGEATRKDAKDIKKLLETSEATLKETKIKYKDDQEFNRKFAKTFGSQNQAGSLANIMKSSMGDITKAIDAGDVSDVGMDFLPAVKLFTKTVDTASIGSTMLNAGKRGVGRFKKKDSDQPDIEQAFGGGIDFVPKDGTTYLHGGERVVTAQQNKDLTSFMEDFKARSFGLEGDGFNRSAEFKQDRVVVAVDKSEGDNSVEVQMEQDKELAALREMGDEKRHTELGKWYTTLNNNFKDIKSTWVDRMKKFWTSFKDRPIRSIVKLPFSMIGGFFKKMGNSLFGWFGKRKDKLGQIKDVLKSDVGDSLSQLVNLQKGRSAKSVEGGLLSKFIQRRKIKKAREIQERVRSGENVGFFDRRFLRKWSDYMQNPITPEELESIKIKSKNDAIRNDLLEKIYEKDAVSGGDGGKKRGIMATIGGLIKGVATAGGAIVGALVSSIVAAASSPVILAGAGAAAIGGMIGKFLNNTLLDPISSWFERLSGFNPLRDTIGKWMFDFVAYMESIPGIGTIVRGFTGGQATAIKNNKKADLEAAIKRNQKAESERKQRLLTGDGNFSEAKLKAFRTLSAKGSVFYKEGQTMLPDGTYMPTEQYNQKYAVKTAPPKVGTIKQGTPDNKNLEKKLTDVVDAIKDGNSRLVKALKESGAGKDVAAAIENMYPTSEIDTQLRTR